MKVLNLKKLERFSSIHALQKNGCKMLTIFEGLLSLERFKGCIVVVVLKGCHENKLGGAFQSQGHANLCTYLS
jgi:hypothetical protein